MRICGWNSKLCPKIHGRLTSSEHLWRDVDVFIVLMAFQPSNDRRCWSSGHRWGVVADWATGITWWIHCGHATTWELEVWTTLSLTSQKPLKKSIYRFQICINLLALVCFQFHHSPPFPHWISMFSDFSPIFSIGKTAPRLVPAVIPGAATSPRLRPGPPRRPSPAPCARAPRGSASPGARRRSRA